MNGDACKYSERLKIDAVCLNGNANEILFVGCKWKHSSERKVSNILEELKGKSKFVQ